MPLFEDISLTEKDFFRAVVLYGRNVASYKFALAESLIGLGSDGNDFVSLEELAIPFSEAICRHLQTQDKQTTARSSTFLDTLRSFNSGQIGAAEKIEATVRRGFINVIDAFHVVGPRDIPLRFFHDERNASNPGIRLTDELFMMTKDLESEDLLKENESRWRLVETAWGYNIPKRLITVDYDPKLELFFAIDSRERRHNVTNAAPALNGYQRGKCFYCKRQINLGSSVLLEERPEVDHFFPHVLQRNPDVDVDLDQAWNLVLACNKCNREKSARCPHVSHVEDLHKRNEYLIQSHHPLRGSIIARTGKAEVDRRGFLQDVRNSAKLSLVHTWTTPAVI